MKKKSAGSRKERLVIWLWRHLPCGNSSRALIAWAAHARYALGAAAVIFNESGDVLLLHHTYRRHGREWGLPAGWVRSREHVERALVREILEETGFTVVIDRLLTVQTGYALPRLTLIFLAHIVEGSFRPSAEVQNYYFCPVNHLTHILPGEQQAIRQALDFRHPQLN